MKELFIVDYIKYLDGHSYHCDHVFQSKQGAQQFQSYLNTHSHIYSNIHINTVEITDDEYRAYWG